MRRSWIIVSSGIIFSIMLGLVTWISWEYMFESKNYRAYNSMAHHRRLLSKHISACYRIDRKPSDQHPFSGGGRLNFAQMKQLIQDHPGQVMVVNLREDAGFYLNDHHISHYGIYYIDSEYVHKDDAKRKKQWLLALRRWLDDVPTDKEHLQKINYLTEQQRLEELGVRYAGIMLERKNFALDWRFVDDVIALFETIPDNTWVHFHCARGRGRTTTLSLMYDMYRNRGTPLNDILQHHFCLGGENILDTGLHPKGTWTKEGLEGRKALVENFHRYINAPDGYLHKTWSQWLEDQGMSVYFSLNEEAK